VDPEQAAAVARAAEAKEQRRLAHAVVSALIIAKYGLGD